MKPTRHLKIISSAPKKRIALYGATPSLGRLPVPQGTPAVGAQPQFPGVAPAAPSNPPASRPLKGDWLSGIRAGLREFEEARPVVEKREPWTKAEGGAGSPGTNLGRYAIQGRLGEGSSAIVYRAVDGDL